MSANQVLIYSEKRLILAALIAPWTAPIVFILGVAIQAKTWSLPYELWGTIALAVFTGYIGLLLLGLPLVRLLRSFGILNLPILIFFGALGGVMMLALFNAILAFTLGSPLTLNIDRSTLIWGSVLGASVATSFGLIAGIPFIGRPYRDQSISQ